jgi:hypothetical protein
MRMIVALKNLTQTIGIFGIYLKLYKVEFKFVNFNSFVIRLNF